MTSPASQSPRGKMICSMPRAEGLLSALASVKGTSRVVIPAWNVRMKFTSINRTYCDLLEPQEVIVELLFKCPFLVHHEGTKWVFTTFLLFASMPTCIQFLRHLEIRSPQIGTFSNSRAPRKNLLFCNLLPFIPILAGKFMVKRLYSVSNRCRGEVRGMAGASSLLP